MTVGEASRQYQIALEAERRVRLELGDVISAEDEVAEAADDLRDAHRQLVDVYIEDLFTGGPAA